MVTPIVREPRSTGPGHDRLSTLEEGLRDTLAVQSSFAYHFLRALRIEESTVRQKLGARLSQYGLDTLLERGRRKEVITRYTSAVAAKEFYDSARGKAKSSLSGDVTDTIEEKIKHPLEVVSALDKAVRIARYSDGQQRQVLRSIDRDKTPKQESVERMIFGPREDQAKYMADGHEPFWVAFCGFQNPADLWPNYEHIRGFYECVIFFGILASGRPAWMVPARAHFLAENADALAKSLDHPDFKSGHYDVYAYLIAFLGGMMNGVVSGDVLVNAILKSRDEFVPVAVYPRGVQHQAA